MEHADHPLRLWRRKNEQTLEEMALGLSTSPATLSRIETGDQGISEDLMRRIAAYTDNAVTPNDLLGIEQPVPAVASASR